MQKKQINAILHTNKLIRKNLDIFIVNKKMFTIYFFNVHFPMQLTLYNTRHQVNLKKSQSSPMGIDP